MKVRDLRQYVNAICGTADLNHLGTDDDELLVKIYGAKSKVDSIIKSSSSFASNAQEQLFYEFVQNAFDANADTLMFNANAKYLVVLNNGAPFISTKDCLINDRPGELYSFLAKGKSDKEEDEESLGQYGQGSKLLYTLISNSGIGKSEDKLIKAIKGDKKGPYLISWENPTQLSNLLLNKSNWEYTDPDDYKNGILICKIVYSYYPITPGIDQTLLSNEEIQDVVSNFDRLVDPKRNLNKMKRGTALIIPLGEGQYSNIVATENIENVRRRLGGFVAVTNNLEINHKKKLDKILVFGEEIVQDQVESINIQFVSSDTEFHYQFCFNPVFAKEGYVNFFKYLPIIDSKLRLGCIINSQNFSLDNSRQRIIEKEKTSKELVLAFYELRKKIENLYTQDKSLQQFAYVHNCLLSSNIPDHEDSKYVKEPFNEVFIPFFKKFILTEDGSYQKLEDIYHIKDKKFRINLKAVGITGKYWVNDDVYELLKDNFGINIVEISLLDSIKKADEEKLSQWIKNLNKEEYSKFHKDVMGIKSYLSEESLFRSNLGNLFSFSEIKSDNCIFYYDSTFEKEIIKVCPEIEYIEDEFEFRLGKDYKKESQTESLTAMYGKISANTELLSMSHSRQEFACRILAKICSVHPEWTSKAVGLKILKDRKGKAKAFKELFKDRPEGTAILDDYLCSYCPNCVEDDWLINGITETWEWMEKHQQELVLIEDWSKNYKEYLDDIVKIHNKAGMPSPDSVKLYVNSAGKVFYATPTIPSYFNKLTEHEYSAITQELKAIKIVPYKLQKFYTQDKSPLDLHTTGLKELVEPALEVNEDIALIFAKLDNDSAKKIQISKLVTGNYKIQKLEENHFNYYEPDIDESTIQKLETINLHLIPKEIIGSYKIEVQKDLTLHSKSTLFGAIRNVKRMYNILEGLKILFPIMEKEDDPEILEAYISCAEHDLHIDRKLKKNDFIWMFIKFAYEHGKGNYIYNKIVFDGRHLPTSIQPQRHTLNGHKYNCYELVDGWGKDNSFLDTFLELLPERKEFYLSCVKGKETEISDKGLYNLVLDENIEYNVQQLRYLLDYATSIGLDVDTKYQLEDEDDMPELLEIISKEHYEGFDNYVEMPDFDSDVQIRANHKYLLEEEYLPDYLEKWLDSNPNAIFLFSDISTEKDTNQILFRKALLDEGTYTFAECDFEDNTTRTDYTAQWILAQEFKLRDDSRALNLIRKAIASCPSEFNILPRYIDSNNEQNKSVCIFSFVQPDEDTLYINHEDYGEEFARHMNTDKRVQNFVKQQVVCDYLEWRIFDRMGLDEEKEIFIDEHSRLDKNASELDSEHYIRWKERDESKGIKIYITPNAIKRKTSISTKEADILNLESKSGKYGYTNTDKERYIIFTYPTEGNRTVMQILKEVADQVGFFQRPFISLQSLYLEQFEKLQEEAAEKGTTIEQLLQQTGSDGGENANMSPALEKLAENLSEEELEDIFANIDRIRNMLNSEEEAKSKVNAMIGYIGELLYQRFLDRAGVKYEYSADIGVNEYDFKLLDEETGKHTYVDVKTNVYSFKDGIVPFYIHTSQGKFLQKHPDEFYHIVRISLEDLNLKQAYQECRHFDDKENLDPRTNERLKEKCRRIADNYWKSANLEHFATGAKKYMIKMELPRNEK